MRRRPAEIVDSFRLRGLGHMLDEIATARHVLPEEIVGRGRSRHHVDARRELAKRMRAELGWAYPSIGWLLDRDHTSIINLVKK